MVLFRTAFLNFRKNIAMNLFTVLEMTATLIIALILVSSILIRYEYYAPVKDYLEENGFYCDFGPGLRSFNDAGVPDNVTEKDLYELLPEAEKIIGCASLFVNVLNGDESANAVTYCYNDNAIELYQPKLSSGRWLNTSENAECLEVVVSQNGYGWKVGDEIEITADEENRFKAKVVGILENGSKIFGGTIFHEGPETYNQLYSVYDFRIEEKPLLLFSMECIGKADLYPGFDTYGMSSGGLVLYPENTDSETINADRKTVSYLGAYALTDLSDFNKNSLDYLYREVYNLLPIIIAVLALALISSISSTALSTRQRLRDYAIYSINGLRWRYCVYINLIQSAFISAVSVLIGIAFLRISEFTALSESIRIVWNEWIVLSIVAIVALYLVISMIMPITIIGKTSPKSILTR